MNFSTFLHFFSLPKVLSIILKKPSNKSDFKNHLKVPQKLFQKPCSTSVLKNPILEHHRTKFPETPVANISRDSLKFVACS